MKIDGADIRRRLIRDESGDSLTQGEDGIFRATAQFRCAWSSVFSLMPRRFQSKHPDFPNLVCDQVSVSKEKGDIARITATYAGGPATGGNFGSNSQIAPIIEIDTYTASFPIETHSDFEDFLAGTPEAPLNGAVFVDGVFTEFQTYDNDGVKSQMAGVKTFDAPVQVVRRISVSNTMPASTRVGFIDTPPVSDSVFDYLKTRHSVQRVGAVYSITEEWTSGPENADINPLIYST